MIRALLYFVWLTTTSNHVVEDSTRQFFRLCVPLSLSNDSNGGEKNHCRDEFKQPNSSSELYHRRDLPSRLGSHILWATGLIGITCSSSASASQTTKESCLSAVTDSSSYSALIYSNPNNRGKKLPLLLVLHGAGNNQEGVWSLADIKGEHAGLLPSLIANKQAPAGVDDFVVVAPYSSGKRSFYEEPRSRLLKFLDWVCSEEGRAAGCPSNIDPNRIFLFGFSDGATVGVELATTRRFKACVICAYGYSGTLPQLALDRLRDIPIWVFHSADDVIFPVSYGDQLVKSLRSVSKPELVRYTRFDQDQEGFTGDVRGHSVGITASRMPAVYDWLLSIP